MYLYKLMVRPDLEKIHKRYTNQFENELGLPIPRGPLDESLVPRSPARSNLFITNLRLLHIENMRSLRVFKGIYVGT